MVLPEYLAPRAEDEIRDNMLATIPDTRDKSEGSYTHDPLAAAAVELAMADDRLRLIMDWVYVGTTFGEFLDRKADEKGLVRRVAVAASGELEVTGDVGYVIPAGREFSTAGSEQVPSEIFAADADTEIPPGGVAVVPVTAVEAGAAGNVAADQVIVQVVPVPEITAVTNPDPMADGLDEETDEALLERYYQRVRNPSSGGNIADYERWALEVAGVGGVAVVPLEDGPGTVTVAIVDLDLLPADAGKVAEVQEYIDPAAAGLGEGKAPIGAAVTVEAATAVPIAIDADLTVLPGYVEADVRLDAEASIEAYLASLTFTDDNDVRIARVITAILDTAGVQDVANVELNGAGANIAIGVKEVATRGATVWS